MGRSRLHGWALAVLACAGGVPVAQESASQEKPRLESVQLDSSLEYLVDFVLHGPQPTDFSAAAGNIAGKRIVTLAVIGMLLEAHPERSSFAEARRRIAAELDRVPTSKREISTRVFGGWVFPFLTFYQLERATNQDGRVKGAKDLIDQIQRLQNTEGGWGHSDAPYTSFYPSTLVATTNLALTALGLLQRFGFEVDEDVLEDGLDLLQEVQSQSGAMPYGGPYYQKGFEAGRTAGSLLAFAAGDAGRSDPYRLAAGYVARNLDKIPLGHASPAMHVFWGGFATQLLGPKTRQEYFDKVLSRTLDKRLPDGSFQDLIDYSPDTFLMASGVGTQVDRAYITALTVAAFLASEVSWLRSLQESVDWQFRPSASAVAHLELPPVQWSATNSTCSVLGWFQGQLVAVDEEANVRFRDATNGKQVHQFEPSIALHPELESDIRFLANENSLIVIRSQSLPDPISLKVQLGQEKIEVDLPETPCEIRCYGNRELLWKKGLSGSVAQAVLTNDALHFLLRAGRIESYDLKSGDLLLARQARPILINTSMVVSEDGYATFADEADLVCLQPDGFTAWKKVSRGKRGLTPPSWGPLLQEQQSLFTSSTHARIERRDRHDGARQWVRNLAGSVTALKSGRTDLDHLYVRTSDGRVTALSKNDGQVYWSTSYSRGWESNASIQWLEDKGLLWMNFPEQGELLALDIVTGVLRKIWMLPREAVWTLRDGVLFVAHEGELRAHNL